MEKLPASAVEIPSGRVALDPIERVFRFENHDEALAIWRDTGQQARILIHVDAHHDLWWIPKRNLLSIANYISPAIQDGIVREVYWVVPDRTWANGRNRWHAIQHAKEILKRCPGASRRLKVSRRQITADLLGRPLRICSLDSLPDFAESVLLDIDVDFFLIPRVTYGEWDCYEPLPWCWPEGLLSRLQATKMRAELVTIAYSVEGGYTPLEWKYLGEELHLRLRNPAQSTPALEGMERLRAGAEAAQRGEFASAERHFQGAQELLPHSAAPAFHLARLYFSLGRLDPAQHCYRRALALDPSYRTPYNNAGARFRAARRFHEAGQEYRRILALDSQDAYAHLGLGMLAARQHRWGEAEASLRRAVELDDQLVDAWRELAGMLAGQQRTDEAIAAYETSLRLTLAGRKSLAAPIVTFPPTDSLVDPEHCHIYGQLGRLYQRKGAAAEAIKRYRISVAGGASLATRCRLAYLFAREGQWRSAGHAAREALRALPRAAGNGARRLVRRAIKVLKKL